MALARSPTIYAPSVRQPPNMTTKFAPGGKIISEDVLEQVGGNNFQDVGEGNDGVERCRIMTIFNPRNVGAAVSRACSEFLLRETPLQAKRLDPISERFEICAGLGEERFRRASMGELARREGREATTAGASRLYTNEQEFKTKLRDIATNAVRQSIKLRLSDSAVLDIGRTIAAMCMIICGS